jgi:hypothetical protein
MTANELADELEGSISILTSEEYYDYANNIELAQTMLRQQAQEIDGLRSKTNTNIDERTANGDKRLIDLLYQKIELQSKEIELLKKELALWKLSDISQEIERELTDEEIMQVYKEIWVSGKNTWDFARAILKKANEK